MEAISLESGIRTIREEETLLVDNEKQKDDCA